MLNIGPQELLIILVIALLVVGPQRLPALGRSIGRGLRELRKAQDEVKRTIQVNLDDEPSNERTRPSTRTVPPQTSDGPRPGPDDGRTAPASGAVPAPTPGSTPTASEPLPANEIREISRSLGRSLSELRRAKEEVQRSFRIDHAGSARSAPSKSEPAPPSEPPAGSGAPAPPSEPDGAMPAPELPAEDRPPATDATSD